MKVFCVTYTDFIKFNRKPNEDYFLVSKNYPIFAIADGVTETFKEDLEYPYPGGARAAAEIFCSSVLEYLEKEFKKGTDIKEKAIREAFNLANERIRELNENEGMAKETINLKDKDFFECVGITALLVKTKLLYGYLSDCGLMILDKNNIIRFKSEDKIAPIEELLEKKYSTVREVQYAMRKYYRNQKNGKGYGSFTGEKEVERYYDTKTLNIKEGDFILLYSDGFTPYFQFPEFISLLKKADKSELDNFTLKKAEENPSTFGTDRTIIAINLS